MRHSQFFHNSVPSRLQQGGQVTSTAVEYGKINPAPPPTRAASPQPGTVENATRARQTDTNTLRSQTPIKKHSKKRRKKKINIWLDPPEIAILIGKAKSEGLSLSATGAAYIKRGIQAEADIHYSTFLQPIIQTLIRAELKRYFSRMILLLARITMTLDVMKGLVKWLARRYSGATNEQVDSVEVRSRTDARLNLIKRTPQLEAISKELEQTLMEGVF